MMQMIYCKVDQSHRYGYMPYTMFDLLAQYPGEHTACCCSSSCSSSSSSSQSCSVHTAQTRKRKGKKKTFFAIHRRAEQSRAEQLKERRRCNKSLEARAACTAAGGRSFSIIYRFLREPVINICFFVVLVAVVSAANNKHTTAE